jgi:hypothetical protein
MNSYVIDTNVLVVANGKYPKATYKHVYICQRFLIDIREKRISIDSLGLILREYFSHASWSGQPGIGDAFAKWLWNNQWNISKCERVEVTLDNNGERGFVEFPDDIDLKTFDMSDRKFVAVAVKSEFDAIICNATDSDWWDHKAHFKKHGIKIKFLCLDLIKKESGSPSI